MHNAISYISTYIIKKQKWDMDSIYSSIANLSGALENYNKNGQSGSYDYVDMNITLKNIGPSTVECAIKVGRKHSVSHLHIENDNIVNHTKIK